MNLPPADAMLQLPAPSGFACRVFAGAEACFIAALYTPAGYRRRLREWVRRFYLLFTRPKLFSPAPF